VQCVGWPTFLLDIMPTRFSRMSLLQAELLYSHSNLADNQNLSRTKTLVLITDHIFGSFCLRAAYLCSSPGCPLLFWKTTSAYRSISGLSLSLMTRSSVSMSRRKPVGNSAIWTSYGVASIYKSTLMRKMPQHWHDTRGRE
jgi:hypothetical protein